MLIELLLSFLVRLLDTFLFFEIPSLPDEAIAYVENLFTYLESGASILANYAPLPYLLTIFGVIVVVDAALIIYKLVMWILKKIPMLGIE